MMVSRTNQKFRIATQSNLDVVRDDSILFYGAEEGFEIKEINFEPWALKTPYHTGKFIGIDSLSFETNEGEINRILKDIQSLLRKPVSLKYLLDIDKKLGEALLQNGIEYDERDHPDYFIAGKGHLIPGPPPENYMLRKQDSLLNKVLLEKEMQRGINLEGYTPRLIGLVDGEKIGSLISSGHTFSEDLRCDGIINHGKYSHRLQLAIIMQASEEGKLNLGLKSLNGASLSQKQLMEMLVKVTAGYEDQALESYGALWGMTLDSADDISYAFNYARIYDDLSLDERKEFQQHITSKSQYKPSANPEKEEYKQYFNPERYSCSNAFPGSINASLMFAENLTELHNLGNYLRNSHWKVSAQMCLEAQNKIPELVGANFSDLYTACTMYQVNDGQRFNIITPSKISPPAESHIEKSKNYEPMEVVKDGEMIAVDSGITRKIFKANDSDLPKKESIEDYMNRKRVVGNVISATSAQTIDQRNQRCCIIS